MPAKINCKEFDEESTKGCASLSFLVSQCLMIVNMIVNMIVKDDHHHIEQQLLLLLITFRSFSDPLQRWRQEFSPFVLMSFLISCEVALKVASWRCILKLHSQDRDKRGKSKRIPCDCENSLQNFTEEAAQHKDSFLPSFLQMVYHFQSERFLTKRGYCLLFHIQEAFDLFPVLVQSVDLFPVLV